MILLATFLVLAMVAVFARPRAKAEGGVGTDPGGLFEGGDLAAAAATRGHEVAAFAAG